MRTVPFTHLQLLRSVSVFTYGCVGLLLGALSYEAGPDTARVTILGWWISFVTFGAAYFTLLDGRRTWHWSVRVLLLVLMSASALLITYLTQTGVAAVLLWISAAAIAWVLPLTPALSWMIGQNLAALPILASHPKLTLLDAVLSVAMYLGCSSFVFMTAWIAKRQTEAGDELRKVNFELRAAQLMLSDTERTAERLRISRELHDLVGHHLTALSLNLEVASHLTEAKAKQHVVQAQTISKRLLSDVREVVSALREGDPTHLNQALQALVAGVPAPQVHLQMPEHFVIADVPRAHAVLRLAQEVLTNCMKHAQARNLWMQFTLEDNGVQISAHDDGRGTQLLRAGNGLSGMRERLHAFGGSLECASRPGYGFNVAAFLPLHSTPIIKGWEQ